MLTFPVRGACLPANCRRICFDIEIANVFQMAEGEDLEQYAPFDISVAAAHADSGELWHWYDVDGGGQPLRCIECGRAAEVLRFLREAQLAGAQVCAWNGLSFDVRWLGHVAGEPKLAAEVALDLFDPMFQFFCARGFTVGLAKVAEGLGIEEKKLMSGADAPREWANGNHQRVLDYVAGDCRITAQVIERIVERREIRWRTQRGKLSSERITALRPVRDVLKDPLPDTSWMEDPKPRERFYRWLLPHVGSLA